MMETSPSPYDTPFLSYAKISCKNEAQWFQKLCFLNFDDGFEFGDLENPYDHPFLQIERILKIDPKKCP